MASPSPVCTVQDGAGAPQATTSGAVVTAGNVITIALSSTAGVNNWSLTLFGQDDVITPPVVTVNNTTKTATFTAPALPWSLIYKSTVNSGTDVNGVIQAAYSTTFKICCLTAAGKRLAASNETLENDSTLGWTSILNNPTRNPGGGGTPPTGTGFYHVTAGVMDAASVALTYTGDTTGTGTGASIALTTVKINGATVPAAGALTTGNGAYVSGVSALTYSALNLAGGAGWVTGALPVGNGGTGLAVVGSPNQWLQTNNAGTAAAWSSILSFAKSSGGGAGSVASAGDVRVPSSWIIRGRNAADTFDYDVLSFGVAGTLWVMLGGVNSSPVIVKADTGGTVSLRVGSVDIVSVNTNNMIAAKPVIGDSGNSSPWGVHGKVTDASVAPFTVTAATYAYDVIRLTDTTTGTVTFPRPSTDAGAYTKFVCNLSASNTKTISNGAGTTVALAANTGAMICFDQSIGTYLKSAAVAVT